MNIIFEVGDFRKSFNLESSEVYTLLHNDHFKTKSCMSCAISCGVPTYLDKIRHRYDADGQLVFEFNWGLQVGQ